MSLRPAGDRMRRPVCLLDFGRGRQECQPSKQLGYAQRDPKVFLLAKWFLGGLEYQGQQHTHFQKHCFVGPAAFGGKANKPFVSETCVVFGLGTQGLKKTLGQQTTSGSLWVSAAGQGITNRKDPTH